MEVGFGVWGLGFGVWEPVEELSRNAERCGHGREADAAVRLRKKRAGKRELWLAFEQLRELEVEGGKGACACVNCLYATMRAWRRK